MDLRKIKKLIELVEESGITELEVRDGEEVIRIARHVTAAGFVPATQPAAVAAHRKEVRVPISMHRDCDPTIFWGPNPSVLLVRFPQ